MRAVAVLLAFAALALAGSLGIRLRGHAAGGPAGAGALDALLSRSPDAIVFSEFGIDSDTIWAANPSEPNDRVQLGKAAHAANYGVFPALSPDGSYVAYTALGAGSADSSNGSTAQLWLVDVKSSQARALTDGIDLRSAPVWSPASDAIVVRRATGTASGASDELLRVDLGGATQTITAGSAGLYPIGFSPDGGALYYASLSASGTDLLRAPATPAGAAGAPKPVAHLSDGIARNWHLSPDGKRLAYLAQAPAGVATAFVAQVLDLDTGSIQTPLGADASAQFSPIWNRSDSITVGRVSSDQRAALRIPIGGDGAAAGAPLPAPETGFDVPLSWSPDGAWLVTRAFEGASPADPGPSHVVAIDANGARHRLSPESDVEIAGWLRPEPAEGLTAP